MNRIAKLMFLLALAAPTALAADANERKFISGGMTEAEVIIRIGRPDSESALGGSGSVVTDKQWTYFPAPGDSQTLTVITIVQGRVANVERRIMR